MAFCTKCGKELGEGDKFCFHCGAAVPVERQPQPSPQTDGKNVDERTQPVAQPVTQSVTPPVYGQYSQPSKKKKGNSTGLIVGIIVGVVAFLALAAFLLITGIRVWKSMHQTKYVNYENNQVYFSMKYPEGYQVKEPEKNNVLITEGKDADFQVSAEYAYYTTGKSAIYSAKDFAEQIEADEKVVKDWLGSDEAKVGKAEKTKVADRDCYKYTYTLTVESEKHKGELFLIEGDGDFGCYSLMWTVNTKADDAEDYEEQCRKVVDSFKITGKCQAENYQIHSFPELGCQFMMQQGTAKMSDYLDDRVMVYPVDGVFTDANISVVKQDYDSSKSVDRVFELNTSYFFKYKEQTQYTSKPTSLEYGRYDITGVDLIYYDKGKRFSMSLFTFLYNNTYWTVSMEVTDEYYESAATCVSDILFSLKIGGEENSDETIKSEEKTSPTGTPTATPTSTPAATPANTPSGQIGSKSDAMVKKIITDVKSSSDFYEDSLWEPLAAYSDFNGDGTKELLLQYERKKSDGGIDLMYSLWTLKDSGQEELFTSTICAMAGGNSGMIGIAKKGNTYYLAEEIHQPEDNRFYSTYSYCPWSKDISAVYMDESYWLECRGTFGKEKQGQYILGATKVSRSKFNRMNKKFQWKYRLDMVEGKNKGNVKTFDKMLADLR